MSACWALLDFFFSRVSRCARAEIDDPVIVGLCFPPHFFQLSQPAHLQASIDLVGVGALGIIPRLVIY